MRLTPARRWLVTLAVAALAVGLPLTPRLVPVATAPLGEAALLGLVRDAPEQGWSGYVETRGTLQLPAAGDLDDVGALLGESTRLRVWWRGPDSWRVDRLLTAGETDLRHDGRRTVEYSYEAQRARVSEDPDIRLPRTSDLLPNELARRLVGDAQELGPGDVEPLDPVRVAGIDAAGLRLDGTRASDGRSSIDHVDLWLDPATGVALRVEVWARGATSADFTSEVRDYTAGTPAPAVVAFEPSATTDVERVEVLDIADAANQYAPLRPPPNVAGLAQRDSSRGAVGVYGSGLTQVITIPLRGREAGALRDQVATTPGAVAGDDAVGATVGPLGLLVTGRGDDGGWLIAGTLTQPVLGQVAADLAAGTVYLPERER